MKKALKVIIIVLAVIIVIGAGGIFYIMYGLNTVGSAVVSAVDPSSLSDGIYEGEYNVGRWSNKVAVTVENGKITEIKIIKDVSVAVEGISDELFKRVIEEQNTTVDAVSGATVTSKAYLKSIEDALDN